MKCTQVNHSVVGSGSGVNCLVLSDFNKYIALNYQRTIRVALWDPVPTHIDTEMDPHWALGFGREDNEANKLSIESRSLHLEAKGNVEADTYKENTAPTLWM